jgi:hypothetical protein
VKGKPVDNFDLINFDDQEGGAKKQSSEDKPLKIDLAGPKNSANGGVSRQPLNLGGGAAPPPAAATPKAAAPAPAAKPAPKISYTGPAEQPNAQTGGGFHSEGSKITSVKTFFTKLHHGSVQFMDEQIAEWLKSNPGVEIKQTNVCVGDVVAKKTEPNIIVMIWY